VTAAGGHQKAHISDIKQTPISQAATHITTAATSVGAVAANASANLAPVQQALPHVQWFGYVLGGLAVVSACTAFLVKTISDVRAEAAKGSATAAIDLDADAGHPAVPVNDNPPAPGKAA